jgi:hypothetical protein
MKTTILIYLLLKCAFRQTLTLFDIALAQAAADEWMGTGWSASQVWGPLNPDWLSAIVSMEQEAALPEAWGLFVNDVLDWVEGFLA